MSSQTVPAPAVSPPPSTETGKILVVDDQRAILHLTSEILRERGYHVVTAEDGIQALERIKSDAPDVIVSDVVMPNLDGYELCRRLRADPRTALLPVILLTSLDPGSERMKAVDSGADDFLPKPAGATELLSRVRAFLRVKRLQDEVHRQADALRAANARLEERVRVQGNAVEQLDRIKRFFPPVVAEAIIAGGGEILKPHRRRITAVFLDLRGFTAFTDRADPEEVLDLLRAYHEAIGRLAERFEGTLEHFAGDGMMIFFNDPMPVERPAASAVRMALEAQKAFEPIAAAWLKQGQDVGLGIGIAQGAATLGLIGFENRWEYAAIGNVPNLAARLCGQAQSGEIVLDSFTQRDVTDIVETEPIGMLTLRGFTQPVAAFKLRAVRG